MNAQELSINHINIYVYMIYQPLGNREREIRKKEKIYNEKRQKVKKGKREKERQTEEGKRLKG